jgi:hypothetical protein
MSPMLLCLRYAGSLHHNRMRPLHQALECHEAFVLGRHDGYSLGAFGFHRAISGHQLVFFEGLDELHLNHRMEA